MIRDILSRRRGECLFCITDDAPFFFCGEPVWEKGRSYCAAHHRLCHNGFGAPASALESMINNLDFSVRKSPADRSNTVPVDMAIRGEE